MSLKLQISFFCLIYMGDVKFHSVLLYVMLHHFITFYGKNILTN